MTTMTRYTVTLELETDLSEAELVASLPYKVKEIHVEPPKRRIKHLYELHITEWVDAGYGVDRRYKMYDLYNAYTQDYLLGSTASERVRTVAYANNPNAFTDIFKTEALSRVQREKLRRAGIKV